MDDEKSLCLFVWITSREKFFSISANSNHELLPCKTLIFDKITNQSTPFYVKFKTSSLHVLRKVLSARQLFFLKAQIENLIQKLSIFPPGAHRSRMNPSRPKIILQKDFS